MEYSDRLSLMKKGIAFFDDLVRNPDKAAAGTGAAAGVAVPGLLIEGVGSIYGLAGGAAIMKTLAVAGGTVGAGATAGIWVVGIGSVGVGWAVAEGVRRLRRPEDETGALHA